MQPVLNHAETRINSPRSVYYRLAVVHAPLIFQCIGEEACHNNILTKARMPIVHYTQSAGNVV